MAAPQDRLSRPAAGRGGSGRYRATGQGYLKRGESFRHSSKSTVIFIFPPPGLAGDAGGAAGAAGVEERRSGGTGDLGGVGGRSAASSAARSCGGHRAPWT